MNKMQKVEVTVKGLSPLLMHQFPMVPIEAIEKKPPQEQAEIGAYRDPGGVLYVPAVAVQRCIIAGAAYVKGKGRASLQKPVAACLLVSPERITLGSKKFELDARPVVMPATKGRVMRYRARLDTWKLTFSIEYDGDLASEPQMRAAMDSAGSRCGLLDFRPERKGPFGRFMVTEWNS